MNNLVVCCLSSLRERSLSLRLGLEELDSVIDIYITITIHSNFGIKSDNRGYRNKHKEKNSGREGEGKGKRFYIGTHWKYFKKGLLRKTCVEFIKNGF